ncbi:MAG: SPFH domain-containing protein [Pseudomonadota bacterium]
MWTQRPIDALLGVKRLVLDETQRAFLLENGRFKDVLGPGRHVFWDRAGAVRFEVHDLGAPQLASPLAAALLRARPDLAETALLEVRAGADELALVSRDGRLWSVLRPEGQAIFWRDAGPWSVERVDLTRGVAVAPALARRLERFAGARDLVARFTVGDEQAGLLHVDGAFEGVLAPGAHAFWSVGRRVEVRITDLRRMALDVTGQEILTKDRVSIRVNLAAHYRVVDPVKARRAVDDFADALYRALQYAFRKTLGAKTLDQILEEKVSVDAEAAARVKAEMAEIGVEVSEIALKDVVLPGEMREILNQVVAAEKQAQANVIRRREETAATRSLLNTAKVMAENPIMLRLKELEALETISSRVDSLVVHNGPKGLLRDIATLSEES